MKRTYPIDAVCPVSDQDLIRQIVFHEAGHAAAIYFCNKQKQPPEYFQITKKSDHSPTHIIANRGDEKYLIHSLPVALMESANYPSSDEEATYQTAFEADMVNLLVGPLAEAKHVALRDNECFNKNLININALHHYGGQSDLEKVYDYLENSVADVSLHDEKLAGFFNKAFQFIDSPAYWKAIERLAGYILDNTKYIMSCEEAIGVLDESIIRHNILQGTRSAWG